MNSSRVSWLIAALLTLPLTGCLSLRSASSGYVGCPPEEIEVRGESLDIGARTWTAVCRGRVFACTEIQDYGSHQGPSNVSCAEQVPLSGAAPASPAQGAAAAGCQFDTQCKGERVCRKGVCEDPAH